MLESMQLLALFLLAITMTCAAAHVLEYPGKKRLPKDIYFAVQTIYYPGFTMAGFAEFAALPVLAVLLYMTPRATPAFALTLGALISQCAVQLIFWTVTQPVNKAWLADLDLGRAGKAFFRPDENRGSSADWTWLRDRWEYSHMARGMLATAALMLLAAAIAFTE